MMFKGLIMRDALKQLMLTNLRELIRDKMTFFFVLIFPFVLLFIFFILSLSNSGAAAQAQGFDPLRYLLPGILVMSFTSLGVFGLATPLITLRQRGTLRLLGMTPLSPLTFVIAQVAARFLLAFVQLVAILILSFFILGNVAVGHLPGIFLSALLGILMLFALGYVLGEVIPSPEAAGGLIGGLLAPILMLTGVLLPFSILPDFVLKIARFIPLTYLGDALRQQFIGGPAIAPLPIDNLVLFGSTVALFLLAVRLFHWAQPDATSRRATRRP